MSDRDVILMDRESDRLAELDNAIEEKAGELYYDAFDDLARDGRLFDDDQQYALDDALWAGHAGGIDAQHVAKLVGDVFQVACLDTLARERRDAAIGRYVREMYERHVLSITYGAAVKAVQS